MKKPYLYLLSMFLVFLFATLSVHAQLLTNDNTGITITPGSQMTVLGDIQNQNAGTITNNGTIGLSGNWINNAANNCFGTSSGTVVMNGSTQTLGGTNATLFNNLVLQGTGPKTLTQNIFTGGNSASGILNLLTRLDLNSKTLSVLNSSTNAITGTGRILSERTDNSSKVKWTINSTTGAHIIPFENAGTADILFTFDLTSGNAGDVTVSTYVTSAANLPLPITPVPVSNINNNFGTNNSNNMVDRFWQVDATGNPTANLTFSWSPSENAAAGNTSPMAQRWANATTGWDTPASGQSNPGPQSVVVNNVSDFGPWAITLTSSPLPIELLSFDASPNNNRQIDLSWKTATEINNDYFTMERSVDGLNFESIGDVDGAGNSSMPIAYIGLDKNPNDGVSYYRLKQTDFDGRFSYSNVVPVEIRSGSLSNAEVIIYPNPAADNVNIQYENLVNGDKIEIFNAIGQVVLHSVISEAAFVSDKVYRVNIDPLIPGIYFIRLMKNNEVLTSQKLVKK